jgi:hypothetical protein
MLNLNVIKEWPDVILMDAIEREITLIDSCRSVISWQLPDKGWNLMVGAVGQMADEASFLFVLMREAERRRLGHDL